MMSRPFSTALQNNVRHVLDLIKSLPLIASVGDHSIFQLRNIQTIAAFLCVSVVSFILWQRKRNKSGIPPAPDSDDPGLLKKHSKYQSFHVPSTGFTYPRIRTFYRAHPQAAKLPTEPSSLPLLVFIHGLGGSAAQFNPLLTSLVNVGPSLCIDLPGCGLSKFAPKDWHAYTTDALAQLLSVIIDSYLDKTTNQGVILVGHSLGCSLAALLASSSSKIGDSISKRTVCLIAICPRASPLSEKQESGLKRIVSLPSLVFDLWRQWDRRGGQHSPSVNRFVGTNADTVTRKLQLRYNEQSKTDVWRRMAHGMLPREVDGKIKGGVPGEEVWAGIDVPCFLIAGESDPVTPPEEVQKISAFLRASWSKNTISQAQGDTEQLKAASDQNSTSNRYLKASILPDGASHALLFAPKTCRTISGLIQSFLADHVDKRLSLGWQLQYLSTEGKWDVKNLAKWQAIERVSEPIAGLFRAMKTMREVDETHCPKVFVKDWAGKIVAVVDISHESPVYDPSSLDEGGIEYHKFPTVSKLPPNAEEIKGFSDLIDQIRNRFNLNQLREGQPAIAVHCHYGFNRTGFFIVCYAVDRMGYKLEDAVREFEKHRPPGIKHDYFIDALYVRYCKGLKRAPTT